MRARGRIQQLYRAAVLESVLRTIRAEADPLTVEREIGLALCWLEFFDQLVKGDRAARELDDALTAVELRISRLEARIERKQSGG